MSLSPSVKSHDADFQGARDIALSPSLPDHDVCLRQLGDDLGGRMSFFLAQSRFPLEKPNAGDCKFQPEVRSAHTDFGQGIACLRFGRKVALLLALTAIRQIAPIYGCCGTLLEVTAMPEILNRTVPEIRHRGTLLTVIIVIVVLPGCRGHVGDLDRFGGRIKLRVQAGPDCSPVRPK